MTVGSVECEVRFAVLGFRSSQLFCMVSLSVGVFLGFEVPFCGVVVVCWLLP